MTYLIRILVGLGAGSGPIVAVHEVQDQTLIIIMASIAVAGFLTACVWRVFTPDNKHGTLED